MIRFLSFLSMGLLLATCDDKQKKEEARVSEEEAVYKILPQPVNQLVDLPEGECVLEIRLDENDSLYINDHPSTKDSVSIYVRSLLRLPDSANKNECRYLRTAKEVSATLGKLRVKKDEQSGNSRLQSTIDRFEKYAAVIDQIGNFYDLDSTAYIRFVSSNKTTYGAYVELQDVLMNTVENMRNEKAIELFGKAYDKLDNSEKTIILTLIPSRIAESTE